MITTTSVATKATIPATTPAMSAGAPRMIAPTAASAIPNTISASFIQLNPSFNIDTKLNIAVTAPTTVVSIPATTVAVPPNTAVKAFLSVEAPVIAFLKASAIPPKVVPAKFPLTRTSNTSTRLVNNSLTAPDKYGNAFCKAPNTLPPILPTPLNTLPIPLIAVATLTTLPIIPSTTLKTAQNAIALAVNSAKE